MNRFRVLIILSVLFLILLVMEAPATETRTFSMGLSGLFMHDNSNITPFPGTIMQFGNEVVTELRVKDMESAFSAEVRLPVNSSYMVGLNFNRPIGISTPGVGNFIQLNQTSDLYGGTNFMGFDVGGRLSLGRDAFSQDSTGGAPMIDESARYLELAGGISNQMLDASFSLELPKMKSEQGNTTDEWSGTGINLNGRFFYQLNEQMTLVPVGMLGFSSSSRTTETSGTSSKIETDLSGRRLNVGVGVQYALNENNLMVVGIDPFGYVQNKSDTKNGSQVTTTVTRLPQLYLGVETQVKSWWKARLGANRAYQTVTTKTKPAGGKETENSFQTSSFNVTFGLGIVLGKILIDVDINDGLLFEGPNFISGQTRDMVNRVSVSYLFSKNERKSK